MLSQHQVHQAALSEKEGAGGSRVLRVLSQRLGAHTLGYGSDFTDYKLSTAGGSCSDLLMP